MYKKFVYPIIKDILSLFIFIMIIIKAWEDITL